MKPSTPKPRSPLTAKRVIDGAVALADAVGMERFTIRRLAESIDVKPMTIYHHVPNKEAIIDGMVDHVFAEIELPPPNEDWRKAITIRSHSMRSAMARHPWAPPLMESRTNPGPAALKHHDAVIGCFRNAGFTLTMTGHAYAVIDAFVYGFAFEEANMPATHGPDMVDLAKTIAEQLPADQYPHLAEFTTGHVLQPGYAYSNEFEFGLNLILEGLQETANPTP